MAVTEQTVAIGAYDVTCDETGCTARFKGVYGLTDKTVRVVAVTDGWTCDVSGDWCPLHAPASMMARMEDIPLLQRGYSRPIGEAEQTSLDALDAAIAAFHEGVTAQLDQRRGYIEAMAAAYFLHTTIAPDEAVLVEQRGQ